MALVRFAGQQISIAAEEASPMIAAGQLIWDNRDRIYRVSKAAYGKIRRLFQNRRSGNHSVRMISWKRHKGYRERMDPRIGTIRRKYNLKAISRKVNKMNCKINQSVGLHVYRAFYTKKLPVTKQQQYCVVQNINSVSDCENQLANLEYYDPSAPTALVTADGTSGAYSKKFCYDSYVEKQQLRNNSIYPVRVTVYLLRCRSDTSLTPLQTWQNGIADVYNSGGVTTETFPLSYPSDSPIFKKLWRILKKHTFVLQPGRQRTVSAIIPRFTYDPAIVDSQSDAYQTGVKSSCWMYVVEGLPSHDSTTNTLIGTGAGSVDILAKRTVRITYDAGANITRYFLVDSQGTVTTQQTTNKPEAIIQ